MGIVWESYHKGVPLLGVPENPTESLKETNIHGFQHVFVSHLRNSG